MNENDEDTDGFSLHGSLLKRTDRYLTMNENDDYTDDDQDFENYEETTVEMERWVMWTFILVSFAMMFLIMPFLVYLQRKMKRRKRDMNDVGADALLEASREEGTPILQQDKTIRAGFLKIAWMDRESKRILRYALPFTISAFAGSTMYSVLLGIVGRFVGAKEMVAIALTETLLGLVDYFLQGPLSANITLCAHAVGASNDFLAGQYVQLSLIFYIVMQIPFIVIWYLFTDDIILFLGWGDEEQAKYALAYVRIAIWGNVIDCVHEAFGNLLEVVEHEYFTTAIELLGHVTVVATLVVLLFAGVELNVQIVATTEVATSALFLAVTVGIAYWNGWLQPFTKGIFRNLSLRNGQAISNMIRVATPLSFGAVLENAEWAILTVFASHMGKAEVGAWAVLGSIWGIFESTTEGIGDTAEIRVAYHLGNNHPSLARLSAYKCLYFGMVLALLLASVMIWFVDDIPTWFTTDKTLQYMVGECLPLVIVGEVILTFGMVCWYIVGAQGRFSLATKIQFGTSYGVTMPLGALLVYYFNYNLEALTCSLVLGYVSLGAVLSYVLLTSDWAYRARKIQHQAAEESEEDESDSDEEDSEEEAEEHSALLDDLRLGG